MRNKEKGKKTDPGRLQIMKDKSSTKCVSINNMIRLPSPGHSNKHETNEITRTILPDCR